MTVTSPAPPAPPRPVLDLALRIAGGVVAVCGGLLTGLIEIAYTPLYWGRWPVPVSIPLAIMLNALLVWFGYRATGHRGAAMLPGAAWFALVLVAATRTTEGDLLLSSHWVPVGTILGGALGWTVAAYRLVKPTLLG